MSSELPNHLSLMFLLGAGLVTAFGLLFTIQLPQVGDISWMTPVQNRVAGFGIGMASYTIFWKMVSFAKDSNREIEPEFR